MAHRFTNVRREWNEYRLGAEATFHGFKFIVTHRWDFYKDDTPASFTGSELAPNSGGDLTTLNQSNRSQPIHGTSGSSRQPPARCRRSERANSPLWNGGRRT